MFIYSNHYLIISKLTQDNFKDYTIDHFFTFAFLMQDGLDMNYIFHEPLENPYTGIDNDTYKDLDYNDYIDLTIYELESIKFVKFKPDFLDSKDENDSEWFLGEREENSIEHFNNMKIINDQNHRSQMTEPFKQMEWSPFKFFKGITRADRKIQKKKERDFIIRFKQKRVFKPRQYPLSFKENIEFFNFPTQLNFVYFLNDYTYEYDSESDNYVDEGYELNHITNLSSTIDFDNHESEFWHEPTFVFPLIRELQDDHDYANKKFFLTPECDRYTSPAAYDWFYMSEFDHSMHRFS